jgi:hypothetical protein
MSEQDLAYRFSKDVDDLLEDAGRVDFERSAEDYREILEIARTLAGIDFSSESQERQSVRRRLFARHDVPAALRDRGKQAVRPIQTNRLRRRLLISITSALALLLAIIIMYPGGPAVAAQRITDGLKIIVLGAYTTVEQIESAVTGQPMPDDSWDVPLFPGVGSGGNGLPGTHPEVRSVKDLATAQEITSFRIQVPDYLPAEYKLKEIKLAPIWTGAGALLFPSDPNAYLFYVGPGPDLVIVQQPVGPQPIGDSGVVAGQVITLATNGTIVEVNMNGNVAAWVDDRLLLWEQGGLSYMVGGLDLDLEEAIQIATSLR